MNAWECPRCHAVNAPHASQCSCKPSVTLPVLPIEPWPQPVIIPMPEPVPCPVWPYPGGPFWYTTTTGNSTRIEVVETEVEPKS